MKQSVQEHIVVYFKGLAMGAADLVPGVSGGTIALITHIYERLINAIDRVSLTLVLQLFSRSLTVEPKRMAALKFNPPNLNLKGI